MCKNHNSANHQKKTSFLVPVVGRTGCPCEVCDWLKSSPWTLSHTDRCSSQSDYWAPLVEPTGSGRMCQFPWWRSPGRGRRAHLQTHPPFIRLLLENKPEKAKGWKHTFELLRLDGSGRLRRLTAAVHIGRQNSEPVLFALCQIKHGVAGRSDGDLSVYALPRSTFLQALRRRRDGTLFTMLCIPLIVSPQQM